MGRTGNADIYGGLLDRLRAASPEAGLGADIIVGFPGETDEDFELLRDFLQRSPLTYFHVFSFSPRKGTAAAGWPPVPDRITTERSKVLRAISTAKNLEFRRSLIGGSVPGVVIKSTGGTPGGAEVLTHNYIRVAADGPAFRTRDIVRVTITGAGPRRTEGRVG
jgi:2-methylthioadenine synthetase